MSSHENPEVVAFSDEQYHEIYTAGFHSAMRVHGNFHSAQDAAQEAAVATWLAEQKKSLEKPAAFGTVVARRRALDEQEVMFGASVCSETVERTLDKGDPAPSVCELIDMYHAVRQAIAALDTDVRSTGTRTEVLQLAALEFTLPEIGEALGITAANAKVFLHRARETLRESRWKYGL